MFLPGCVLCRVAQNLYKSVVVLHLGNTGKQETPCKGFGTDPLVTFAISFLLNRVSTCFVKPEASGKRVYFLLKPW